MSILGTHSVKIKVMLYDSCIGSLKQAICDLEAGDLASHPNKIAKAQNIIDELKSTLGPDPVKNTEENIRQLYAFISDSLAEANQQKNPGILLEIVHILEEINQSWRQAT
jgi:flagellar protein FliS